MFQVLKATGEMEAYSQDKVRRSTQRAGISPELQEQVVRHIESKLYDRIPTAEIYRHILEYLGQSNFPYSKAKYSLKESIMALGPTGYPFEDFVSEILKTRGYQTEVRQITPGKCINHEIDIVAKSADQRIMVEVKFHNGFGTRTDVQDALYTKARFEDVKERNGFSEAWLITNTKATLDTIRYGQCSGLKVVSWSYPETDSLRSMIEKARLSLITSLGSLSQSQKQQLLENHIVLCKDISENPSSLSILGLSQEDQKKILAEARFVYSN